jgi:hypothetical protein
VFLGLALIVGWAFVVGEAANLEHSGPFFSPASLIVGGSSGSSSIDLTNPDITSPDTDPFSTDTTPFSPITPIEATTGTGDRDLQIGLTSGVAALLFAFGLRVADRRRRYALGTAFVIPLVVATVVAVSALGAKVGSTWFGGALALVSGLAVAWLASGRRRFLAWSGALGAAFGVLLVTGDVNTHIGGGGESSGVLHYGLLALAFGLVAVATAAPLAVLLGESRHNGWTRGRPQPPMPTAVEPPA